MSPSEYDADIFFGKQFIFFWRHAFRHPNLHLWNTTVASLEHNRHIFRTQPSHLWNTTCWLAGQASKFASLAGWPASKFASLEHNCCFFRTQPSHLQSTTVPSLEHNVLAVWWGVRLQHCDCFDYNTVTVVIWWWDQNSCHSVQDENS